MHDSDRTVWRSALTVGRVSTPNQAYFVTKCVLAAASRPLARPECAEELVRSIMWARDKGWWRVLGLVVMPDHYHLAIGLGASKSLSEAVAGVSKFSSARINGILRRSGHFWEEGFYDHAIRDRRDFDAVLSYIHANPVAAGLVESAESWPWSTANPRFAPEVDWDWLGTAMVEVSDSRHRFDPDLLPRPYR